MAGARDHAMRNLMGATLSRRQLLALGSAGLVSAVALNAQLSGRTSGLQAMTALGRRVSLPLGIGYSAPAANASGSLDGLTSKLVAAEQLRTGDHSLAGQSARLRVLGLYPRDNPA